MPRGNWAAPAFAGSLYGDFYDPFSPKCIRFFVPFHLLRAVVLAALSAIRLGSEAECRRLYYTIGGLLVALAVLVGTTGPSRLPADDFFHVAVSLLTALLAFAQATASVQYWAASIYAATLWTAVLVCRRRLAVGGGSTHGGRRRRNNQQRRRGG